MTDKYILKGKEIIPVDDLIEWAKWYENPVKRVLDQTEVGKSFVSTVFLGFNHSFSHEGPPVLFETMIFGGSKDQEQWRYETYDEAMAGHAKIVKELLGEEK